MKNKFRHELKYFINLGDYYTIKNRLKHFMVLDQNAGGAGYKIRSLYFDNANNKALMEKISGINNREKFRIRFYNGNSSYIKLEKKSKINGLCRKEAERITEEECRDVYKRQASYFTLRSGGKTVITFLFDSMFVWICSITCLLYTSRCV